MKSNPQKDIVDILYLFNQSQFHLGYSLSDFNSFAILPYLAGNSVLTHKDDTPTGFSSWVFLTPHEGQLVLANRFSWPSAIHERPKADGLDLWCIEFIAPFGNIRQLTQATSEKVRNQLGPCSGYFRRSYAPTIKKKWIIK